MVEYHRMCNSRLIFECLSLLVLRVVQLPEAIKCTVRVSNFPSSQGNGARLSFLVLHTLKSSLNFSRIMFVHSTPKSMCIIGGISPRLKYMRNLVLS